ncbi:Hypothetical protein CAP_6040 [Chondromyces apiculatus DSM 436]|uniref:TauD/TfdA-like domain-containing protein n=2 Tax=Chondromyces apiculatus TaxID=51 RepID=A0A017TGA7_9BACT|nr:Hypothetical protein CAP_6040 [Chondromyces apiculatus DSM 436]
MLPTLHPPFTRDMLHGALVSHGYAYLPRFSPDSTGASVVALARSLGSLYVPPGTDPERPFIETRPSAGASSLEPFDRSEAIGWHNDFSTHTERPALSLAYLTHPDAEGPAHGAWRVASCDLVLDQLRATQDGRNILRFLSDTALPYSFTGEGEPTFFRAVAPRGPTPGRLGLRFYGRAMRDGARLAYRRVPEEIEHALTAVETAADQVGHVLAAPAGALLVTDNWHALHDRLIQSVDPARSLRRSLLCFVDLPEEPRV